MVVPPSEQVHATHRDEVFLRVGDEDRRLDFEQRIQLRYDRGDTTFEKTPARTYGDDSLNFDAVAEYAAKIGAAAPDNLLQARDLIDLATASRSPPGSCCSESTRKGPIRKRMCGCSNLRAGNAGRERSRIWSATSGAKGRCRGR